ncbi:hypothetical protein QBC45DRAFT_427508, partial [Copromyces sp. CBS 386.78]
MVMVMVILLCLFVYPIHSLCDRAIVQSSIQTLHPQSIATSRSIATESSNHKQKDHQYQHPFQSPPSSSFSPPISPMHTQVNKNLP